MSDHGTRVFSHKRTLETPVSLWVLCGRAPRGRRGRLGWGCSRRIKTSALHIWQIIGWGWSGEPLVTFVTKVLVQGFHWGWTHQTLLRGFRCRCLLLMFFRLWMVCGRDWIGCRVVTWNKVQFQVKSSRCPKLDGYAIANFGVRVERRNDPLLVV